MTKHNWELAYYTVDKGIRSRVEMCTDENCKGRREVLDKQTTKPKNSPTTIGSDGQVH